MPKIVVTHNVVDVENWLKGKDERAASLAAMGGSNVVDYVAQDGSNTIAITGEVADLAGMLATLANPSAELKGAMERHGVLPPLTVFVEK